VAADFVVIEVNPRHCQELRDQGHYFIEGDATHEKVLMEAGIKSAQGLLALLESDPDNLFIVLTARELNPTLSIIARAEEASSEKKVLRAGADRVISPFATAGRQIADDILLTTGRKTEITDCFIKPKTIPRWIAAQNGSNMMGKTISGITSETGSEVIGLRRDGHDIILPDPETIIESDDMLLVIEEEPGNGKQLHQINHENQKVVIVDDNPVILTLYARLFQKAGFNPVTATNGPDGLEIIKKEKPAAAVIDFQIPILSGIEVCREVRKAEGCQGIKLILFTGDDRPEIQKRAIKSGADRVVLKSPEASELIEIVVQTLR
jgi:voltage-gated potassium channel